MKIVEGNFGPKANENLANDLRELADAVDRGDIVDFVASYIEKDEQVFFVAAELRTALVLAVMLQDDILQECKGCDE